MFAIDVRDSGLVLAVPAGPDGVPRTLMALEDAGLGVSRMPENQIISCSRGAPPPRIVVTDDDIDIRDLIALMLRSRGFDVVIASCGDAALAAILSDGADGLVSDLQMPGLGGFTLCRVLRGLCAYTALPIVIFTGVGHGDPRLLPLRDINELRILHKPMGLREIAPALTEMIPTTLSGFGVGMKPRVGTRNGRGGDMVAGRAATLATH
jgi:CheY-like chemotaxis protein